MAEGESGYKWWVRFVLVPLAGGICFALIVALKSNYFNLTPQSATKTIPTDINATESSGALAVASGTAENHPFTIASHTSDSVVSSERILIEGTGAYPGDTVRIEIFTNDWYQQDGNFKTDATGNWTLAPAIYPVKASITITEFAPPSFATTNKYLP